MPPGVQQQQQRGGGRGGPGGPPNGGGGRAGNTHNEPPSRAPVGGYGEPHARPAPAHDLPLPAAWAAALEVESGSISFTDAFCIFLRRDELEEAASRAGEDVHSLFRGALVRVRGPDSSYAVREVFRAKLGPLVDAPNSGPVLQLQLFQEPDDVYTSDQVSNAPVTLQEWRSYTAELARDRRVLSLAHARAVCHNLGRPPPPGTPGQATGEEPHSRGPPGAAPHGGPAGGMSAEDAERARRRAARFGGGASPPRLGPDGQQQQPPGGGGGAGVETRVFRVPQPYMGALIGSKHQTVNSLRVKHGVECVVDSSRCTATVTGHVAGVDAMFADFERIIERCIATQAAHQARNAGGGGGGPAAGGQQQMQQPGGASAMTPMMTGPGAHNPAGDDPRFVAAADSGDLVTVVVDCFEHLGAVIGPKGAMVRRIQAQHGVVVDKMQETKQARVAGARAAVAAAVDDIQQVVHKAAQELAAQRQARLDAR